MTSLRTKLLNRYYSYRQVSHAAYELHEAVKHYLPADPVIVEAGSHEGYDTISLSKLWSRGRVYGFEPVPNLFYAAQERVRKRKNVVIANVALGERSGTTGIYVSGGASNGSSSLLAPAEHLTSYTSVTFGEKLSVPMIALNDWGTRTHIDRIDMMWLDVQGYEVHALRGGDRFLPRVSVIYTEMCRRPLYEGMVTRDDYIEFLAGYGLKLISVRGYFDDDVSDGIFVRK
jgi:FkbM family methyltransferase